ncbi:mitogen activated protein kinase kinase kinase [Echinococcus multilocularis]|uniref:Mitogen activated protein kinase kinase kinase n=1 Tax=Echinococcus multilocularis TaxID=6211 RepID=A0A068Y913_ECHMU|nr:mitogen activated protein kinase kinase kinase [Echinococcus multilocularis]
MIPNIPQVSPLYRSKNPRYYTHFTSVDGLQGFVKWFHYSSSLERRYKELRLLLKLQNHPNIVTLLAAGPDYQNGILEYIVTELASEGDLYHLIHRRRSVEYNLSNALSWMAQLSEALAFLHERSSTPIIHRDVKPANCLIFDGGARLKLCDFGSAESSHLSELMSSTRRGTAGFMAPELFATDSTTPINYTVKSDIFSAAMTFWEILARQHVCPPDESFFVTLVQLVHKHRRPRPLRGCPIFLLRLLERSWSENPEKRPRMHEIADLLGHIKTRILDPGVISHPLFIPPLPSDFPLSPAAAYTTHDQWEAEEDITDSAPQSTWMEDCPAQELRLLSPSPVLLKPLELSVVCDDSDMDYLLCSLFLPIKARNFTTDISHLCVKCLSSPLTLHMRIRGTHLLFHLFTHFCIIITTMHYFGLV